MALRGKTSTRPGYKPGVDIHPTIVAAFPPVVEEKEEAPKKKKRSLFGKKKDKQTKDYILVMLTRLGLVGYDLYPPYRPTAPQ